MSSATYYVQTHVFCRQAGIRNVGAPQMVGTKYNNPVSGKGERFRSIRSVLSRAS